MVLRHDILELMIRKTPDYNRIMNDISNPNLMFGMMDVSHAMKNISEDTFMMCLKRLISLDPNDDRFEDFPTFRFFDHLATIANSCYCVAGFKYTKHCRDCIPPVSTKLGALLRMIDFQHNASISYIDIRRGFESYTKFMKIVHHDKNARWYRDFSMSAIAAQVMLDFEDLSKHGLFTRWNHSFVDDAHFMLRVLNDVAISGVSDLIISYLSKRNPGEWLFNPSSFTLFINKCQDIEAIDLFTIATTFSCRKELLPSVKDLKTAVAWGRKWKSDIKRLKAQVPEFRAYRI